MSATKFHSSWHRIIGVALLALVLAGCSMVRLGYSQAPTLTYWWLDGYLDLDGAQSARLRDDLDRFFEWHRKNELPAYAALLARGQREVMEPSITPAAFCAWRDELQKRIDATAEQATPPLAALVLTLTPEQLKHFERQIAKGGESMRKDFAHPDRDERAAASFKRTLERYENFYGKLDEAQRTRLAQLLAASPFDPERWLAERERRNRDMIATLASTAAAARSPDAERQARVAVRLLVERAQRSPRPEYRAYQERLAQDNCALASAMHASTTPAQRRHARDKLKGWEEDMRLLAQQAPIPTDLNRSR
jgi:Family of unknown function (DUF6279)